MQSQRTSGEDGAEQTFASLSALFERLACAAKSSAMAEVVEADLTFSQFRTLMELGASGAALSVNELADAVHLSVAAAGRVADKLVALGYADRREDPIDRRVKRVSLTEQGRTFVTSAINNREDVLRDFARRLPPDVAANLVAALEPVLHGENDYFAAPEPSTES
ncbi:MarR family winged helix-turn-helix transcriptional regulator [Gordonia araii]|uniref:MarR family winged helix-turn-helix transcriptional regulator n=1 Tax=Gordonia araii TaxID=263909 RepID=UPI00030BF192|nr:MarR family transcriptional regulator [Gordonia araii]